MAKNVTDMLTAVRRLIKKDQDATLTADLLRYLNEARIEIQPFAGADGEWSLTVAAATTETWTIASDITSGAYIWRLNAVRLLKTGTTDKLANYSEIKPGKPLDFRSSGYWIHNGKLYKPGGFGTTGTAKFYGEQRLKEFVESGATAAQTTTTQTDDAFANFYEVFAAMRYGEQKKRTGGGEMVQDWRFEVERLRNAWMQWYMEKTADIDLQPAVGGDLKVVLE